MFNQSKKSWMAQLQLQTLIAPNVVSDELLVFSNFYTTNYPSTTNCFFVTTVSPINWSLFFRFNPAGLMYWTKVQRIPTKWWKDFPHHKNKRCISGCATHQQTNGWNPKNAGLEDDLRSVLRFCFREKFPTNSVPFPRIFSVWSKAWASHPQNAGMCFSRHQKCIRWGNQGVWGCRLFTLWLKIRRWKPSSAYRIWNHFWKKCCHWKQGKYIVRSNRFASI